MGETRTHVAAVTAIKVASTIVAIIDQPIATAVSSTVPATVTGILLGTAANGDVALATSELQLCLPSWPCPSEVRVMATTQLLGKGLILHARTLLLLLTSWVAVNIVLRLTGVLVHTRDNADTGRERQGERGGGVHSPSDVLISFSFMFLVVIHVDAVVAVAVSLRSTLLLTTAMTTMTSLGSAVAKLPAGAGRQGTAGLGRICPLLLILPTAACDAGSRPRVRGGEAALALPPSPQLLAADTDADEVHPHAINQYHCADNARGVNGAADRARSVQ